MLLVLILLLFPYTILLLKLLNIFTELFIIFTLFDGLLLFEELLIELLKELLFTIDLLLNILLFEFVFILKGELLLIKEFELLFPLLKLLLKLFF